MRTEREHQCHARWFLGVMDVVVVDPLDDLIERDGVGE
jgi:hypothetical protein